MKESDPPLKVLLVLATSGGGVGRHIAQLAAGLAERPDFQITVAGPADTDQTFGFSKAGADFAAVGISDRPRAVADRRAVRQLRELAIEAEVVHAHGLRAGALAVLGIRGLPPRTRPKLVVTLHNALLAGGRTARIHGVLERIVARRANVVLVVSADLGAAIRHRGARDVRAAVVPAPLLPPALRMAPEERGRLGLPEGVALLVTVARLAPQKGLGTLLEAVRRLSSAGVSVQSVIAGDGPLADTLVRDAALGNVPLRLLGERADVADLIGAADVVVVPSLWEGQSLIVQEALLCGAAIVATDSGGTAALVGNGAVLVPPSDPVALAGAILGLLSDPQARAQLRQRALAQGQSLPGEHEAIQQVVTVYNSLTDRDQLGISQPRA